MVDYPIPKTAAEALLMRLKFNGVDYLFGNAGTDFAPIIEAYANSSVDDMPMPVPLVMPHETAALGMAHGYYRSTGKPQAAMVHVNVGLANALMGVINAASDNVPLFMMAGRTPLTEFGRVGARMTPIQYGQEMRDQNGLVRESTKWDYELRYPEQTANLVDRGVTISMSAPRGPVYLGLPREPLAEAWPEDLPIDGPMQSIPTAASPNPDAIQQAAALISKAKNPLIICQRSDPEGTLGCALLRFIESQAIPVAEPFAIQNVLATGHPMHGGFNLDPWLENADVVLSIDAPVPWIPRNQKLTEGAEVIHIGVDPLFSGLPMRSYQNDLSITSDPALALNALNAALKSFAGGNTERYKIIQSKNKKRREGILKKAKSGNNSPMTPLYVGHCISNIMEDDSVLFSELGVPFDAMDLKGPNRASIGPYSGGLGWGVPSALGAALANPDRLAIAAVGDGSYIFANPVACHQISEALNLPILIVILNNGIWNAVRRAARNVFPEGSAIKMNTMPLTSLEPSPDFCAIAEASRGWSERVGDGEDLPGALARAIEVVKVEKRSALLEVRTIAPN
jgi:acetolactate synthase-1/2/3 large subunit